MPTMTIDQAMQLAMEHHGAGRRAEAEQVYRAVLGQQPNHGVAMTLLGALASEVGNQGAAEGMIRRAIELMPRHPMPHFHLGRVLAVTGRFPEAAEHFRRSLEAAPGNADVMLALGETLQNCGRAAEGEAVFRELARIGAGNADAFNNLGTIHRGRGEFDQAMSHYEKALALNPNLFAALSNYGVILAERGRHAEAIAAHEKALAIHAGHPVAFYNYGLALGAVLRYQEAIRAYRRAIELNGDYFEAHNNLANAYRMVGQLDEAEAALRKCVALRPNLAEAYTNLAGVLHSKADYAGTLENYGRAMALRPDMPQINSNYVYSLLFHPAYTTAGIQAELTKWNDRHGVPLRAFRQEHKNERSPERRLRIGFVSAEMRDHVVARNLAPIFRERDRAAYEVFCYANHDLDDAFTDQMRALTDGWRVIRLMRDEEVAAQIRADRIDILVDLTLHMSQSRLPMFGRRPAPVQATFAGYPGSTGLETIDYRLTDPFLDPPEISDGCYSEKSIRLPETFWCYDPLGETISPNDLPCQRAGRVTFGCLNNFYKVNDTVVELFAAVLRGVEGSRLILMAGEGDHRTKKRQAFQRLGVAAERIEFVGFRPRGMYLESYHEIDVSLDTVPYNGHTTSLDSLWMGVPVVTLVGKTVVGRAGYSQLMNLEMPELIAYTPEEYVAKAVELARDVGRLKEYRRTLRGRMEKSPLMDGPRFARNMEAAFREMWRRWCETGGSER